MPSYSIIENFEVHKNNHFLEISESLKPELHHKEIKPAREILVGKDRQMRTVVAEEHPVEALYVYFCRNVRQRSGPSGFLGNPDLDDSCPCV